MKAKGATTTPLSLYLLGRDYNIEFLRNAIKVGADINITRQYTPLMGTLYNASLSDYSLISGLCIIND